MLYCIEDRREDIFASIRSGGYKSEPITAEHVAVVSYSLASRHGVHLTLQDISFVIHRLRESQPKLNIAPIAMRMVPGGYYSEDIERFFGRLCGAGYAKWDSNGIRLTDNGRRLYQELIGEFFSSEPLVFAELTRLIWQVMYPRFFKAPVI